MTFDEAMHEECTFCGDEAQWHRLTDSGNFYCLQPARGSGSSWIRSNIRNRTPKDQRQWAISRAKCNDLHRSPLSTIKGLGDIIIKVIRRLPEPIGEQLAL